MFSVSVYVNEVTKEFSATSRDVDHSHWTKMDKDESEKGFVRINLLQVPLKSQADASKAVTIALYENAGYTRVTRPATYVAKPRNMMRPVRE